MKINKKTTLAEAIKNPKAVEILGEYNVPCLSCPFARMEMEELTLEQICKNYDIDIDALIEELKSI